MDGNIAEDILNDLNNPQVPKWLVIGQCGDGKSTLINALTQSTDAKAGKSARGVTKALHPYRCKVINGIVIDTPGVGDLDIKVTDLIELMGLAFKSVEVHAVIVCSKDYTRVQMGGQIVSRLVNMAFKDKKKWENVIFTWTHGDKADDDDIDNLKECIDACMKDIGVHDQRPPICVTKCPANGQHDLQQLVTILERVAKQHSIGGYTHPTAQDLAKAIGTVTGAPIEETLAELEKARKAYAEMQEKLTKELEAMGAKHAADMKALREEQEARETRVRQEANEQLAQLRQEQNAHTEKLMDKMAADARSREEQYAREREASEQRYRDAMNSRRSSSGCVIQ